MKKLLILLLTCLMLISITACKNNAEDDGLVLTGIVYDRSTPAYKDYQIAYLKCENNTYAIVIPKSVDIEWDSKRLRKEIYGTASVDPFYCLDWGFELTVVCGEETEAIPDEPFRGPVEVAKWYTAEKVTISGKGEWVEVLAAKPVIYLYPDEETDVTVTLDYDGELTCTYPKSDGVWNVTAYPDGTLVDANGQEYNYLYWEGVTDAEYDFSKGFCVKGEDTAEFLETALAQLGLTRREANEFIVYWLPLMEVNEYNIIAFQTDVYEENAKLAVVPAPDTIIRVFMAWYGVYDKIEIEPQELKAPERTGFTVIEWGGSEIK